VSLLWWLTPPLLAPLAAAAASYAVCRYWRVGGIDRAGGRGYDGVVRVLSCPGAAERPAAVPGSIVGVLEKFR